MQPGSRRYLLVILLLAAGAGFAWGQRILAAERFESAQSLTPREGDAYAGRLAYTYFVDVKGWYSVTPYEAAVLSEYDLTARSNDSMAAALPEELGVWRQVEDDADLTDDPTVAAFLADPTVALRRTYQDASGHTLTLVVIGNEGVESFALFSHTPEICYPGGLWELAENRTDSAALGEGRMHAQYLSARHRQTDTRLAVLFWYLWSNPHRDATDGILSMRVNLFLLPGESDDAARELAWDFVRELFPATSSWERF